MDKQLLNHHLSEIQRIVNDDTGESYADPIAFGKMVGLSARLIRELCKKQIITFYTTGNLKPRFHIAVKAAKQQLIENNLINESVNNFKTPSR